MSDLTLLCGLVRLSVYDCRYRRIPNRMLAVLSLARCAFLTAEWAADFHAGAFGLWTSVWGGLWGGGVFLLLHMVSRGGLGAGDVKLLAVLGFYLGERIRETAVCSLVLAAAWGVVLLLQGDAAWRKGIPFAPFVLGGTLLTMLREMGGVI